MLLGLLERRVQELDGDQLVAARLEAADDLAHEAALHAVGLDGDERALVQRARLAPIRHGVGLGRTHYGCATRRTREYYRHSARASARARAAASYSSATWRGRRRTCRTRRPTCGSASCPAQRQPQSTAMHAGSL